MKKTILLFITSFFGIWLGGLWACVFYYILTKGSITLVEPTMWILITEFATAVLVTLASVGIFVWTWIRG